MFSLIKKYYEIGLYSLADLMTLRAGGLLTDEEYYELSGVRPLPAEVE